MPYLGSTPNASFSSRTKQDFTANGSTRVFTLSSAVASPNDIEVFVGNVRQNLLMLIPLTEQRLLCLLPHQTELTSMSYSKD